MQRGRLVKAVNRGNIEVESFDIREKSKSKNTGFTKMWCLITVLFTIGLLSIGYLIGLYSAMDTLSELYSFRESAMEENERLGKVYSMLAEVDNIYNSYYIGEMDYDDILNGVLNGYVVGVGDKYGYYVGEEDISAYTEVLTGEFVGIGVRILSTSESMEIVEVFDGSPAIDAGIVVGDKILYVEDTEYNGENSEEIVSLVRGETGSDVLIGLKDREVYVKRQEVVTPTVHYEIIDDIAVVEISSFATSTDDEFITIMNTLQTEGIYKYIFDLRYNGGGLVDAVIPMLDYLLPEGLLMTMETTEGVIAEYTSDSTYVDGEFVVLVNGYSASASELFTLCLRDYEAGVIVGTQTYGKGTAATSGVLTEGRLNFSSALYNTKVSENIEGVGITPDYVVEFDTLDGTVDYVTKTNETDNQLQEALKLLQDK